MRQLFMNKIIRIYTIFTGIWLSRAEKVNPNADRTYACNLGIRIKSEVSRE